MDGITSIRVIKLSTLFKTEDELELFQSEIDNHITYGDADMTLISIDKFRDIALSLSVLSNEASRLSADIMVDLAH